MSELLVSVFIFGHSEHVCKPDSKHIKIFLEENFKLCLSVLLMKMIKLLTHNSRC